MTNISIEALKEKTIGEICELVKKAERLPDNQSPFNLSKEDLGLEILGKAVVKQAKSLPENNSPQTKPQKKLSDKNLEGLSSVVHEPYVDFGMGDKTGDTKTQTAQELLEEIENE